MALNFNESRLLDGVAYGSEFGHSYKTTIQKLRSGVESRNADWARPLGRYSVIFQNLREGDANLVVAAHHACMGQLVGFRFKDWSDYKAQDQVIGFGTGAVQTLQLIKTYTFGDNSNYRNISKPVSVEVKADGAVVAASVEMTKGKVTLTAPDGAEITWSGEFDVPVRFDDDELSFSIDDYSKTYILNSNADLTEIRV